MPAMDLKSRVEAYLDAFEQHDVDRCLTFFADDATISWLGGTYQGQESLAHWHADRFAANLQVTQRDDVRVQGSTVVADLVVTSDRLKTWRLASLGGRVTVTFRGDQIENIKFGMRFTNPLRR